MTEMPTLVFEDYVRTQARPDVGWLAGYARSGAALVRTILAKCFGHCTGTIYQEQTIGAVYAEQLRLVPNPIRSDEMDALIAAQGLLLFKTHEMPRPPVTVPVIVIVRDGRRTLDSLRAFYTEHRQTAGGDSTLVGTDDMTQMIRGEHQWGSWSGWIRAWASAAPADALWLRYEDIMVDVRQAVDRIAMWYGLTPVGYEIPSFESLHQANPTIFRKAAMTGNGGMTEQEEALFWELHGGTMTMLGYRR